MLSVRRLAMSSIAKFYYRRLFQCHSTFFLRRRKDCRYPDGLFHVGCMVAICLCCHCINYTAFISTAIILDSLFDFIVMIYSHLRCQKARNVIETQGRPRHDLRSRKLKSAWATRTLKVRNTNRVSVGLTSFVGITSTYRPANSEHSPSYSCSTLNWLRSPRLHSKLAYFLRSESLRDRRLTVHPIRLLGDLLLCTNTRPPYAKT